jgi:hypothetical protein
MPDTDTPHEGDEPMSEEERQVLDAIEELLDPDEPNRSPTSDSESPPPG